jgi:hypothetical protein
MLDLTTISSLRQHCWYESLDVAPLDHRCFRDMFMIANVLDRAAKKNLQGPFELFGCLFTSESARYLAETITMKASWEEDVDHFFRS